MRLTRILPLVTALAPALSAATASFYTNHAAFTAASTISLNNDYSTGSPNVFGSAFTRNGISNSALSSDIGTAWPGYNNFGADVTQPTVEYIVTGNGNENFLTSFSAPYTAVGFDTFLHGAGASSVSFYDADNVVWGTYTFSSVANDREFIGILSDTSIAAFHWACVGGDTVNTGFSNLAVGEANAVSPEPGTVALLRAGLAVRGLRERRR